MEKPTDSESTLARELLFGLAGGGIAIGCLLPPLLHFVTGPLGPFIGGFIATNLARPGSRGRTIIAAMVGATVAALCALVALGIAVFSSEEGPPSWFPDSGTLGLILLGIWAYSTALGAAGVAARQMLGSSSKADAAQPGATQPDATQPQAAQPDAAQPASPEAQEQSHGAVEAESPGSS